MEVKKMLLRTQDVFVLELSTSYFLTEYWNVKQGGERLSCIHSQIYQIFS